MNPISVGYYLDLDSTRRNCVNVFTNVGAITKKRIQLTKSYVYKNLMVISRDKETWFKRYTRNHMNNQVNNRRYYVTVNHAATQTIYQHINK